MSRWQLLLHDYQCRRLSSHQRSPQQKISVFARCSIDQSAYAHSLSASTTIDYVDHRQSCGISGCFDASYHCPIGHYRWNSATIVTKRCSTVFSSIKLTTETIQMVQQMQITLITLTQIYPYIQNNPCRINWLITRCFALRTIYFQPKNGSPAILDF